MIDGLADYCREMHEYEMVETYHLVSIYIELLTSWRKLARCNPYVGKQQLANWNAYWSAMQKWYAFFSSKRDQIYSSIPITIEGEPFLIDTVETLQEEVYLVFPKRNEKQVDGNVVGLQSFYKLLNEQVDAISWVDLWNSTVADVSIIMDYWHRLSQFCKVYQK